MIPHQPNAFGPLGESHTIDTPEQTQLHFTVAGIGSRFLALAMDLAIQAGAGIVLLIAFAVVSAMGVWTKIPYGGTWAMAIMFLLIFLIHFGYFIGFEILWRGQTPGKRAAGIRVLKDTGRPLSPAETIGRNLMRIVDQLPGFYAVAIVTAMLNAQNRRLGDFVAGSIVVREGSLQSLRPEWPEARTEQPQSLLGASQLTPEDLALIDTFLIRRSELAADVRSRMASGILDRLRPKLPPGTGEGMSTETLLEQLAFERRSSGGYN